MVAKAQPCLPLRPSEKLLPLYYLLPAEDREFKSIRLNFYYLYSATPFFLWGTENLLKGDQRFLFLVGAS